jgi:rRNA maturation protein Nop10
MRAGIALSSAIVIGLLMAVTQSPAAEGMMGEKAKTMEKKEAMTQAVYVCPDCHMMALKEEKCPMCGKEMQKSHVLGTKDGEALICACGAGCTCDAKGMKDGKCACGKDVMKVSAKGMYVCPEGCPDISAKAGKCPHCGKEMKKVE